MSNKLPSAFLRSLIENYHVEIEDFVKSHDDQEQVISVRLNPFKPAGLFEDSPKVSWCTTGRYLSERPSFTADPLFHAGCYYVQEASSMFLEQVLKHSCNLSDSITVLDLCAAPGGKSTHINSLISIDSLLVSNEIIKSRVPVLSDNLSKWGRENVVVTNNDPRDFKRLGAFFDVIVVDAPCSGSGMFRKDPEAIDEWSENAVELCSQRQKRILADIYPALKEGGTLIYSTCSYSKEENESIADWLCDNFGIVPVTIPVEPDWNITETFSDKHGCPGYRFYPHKVQGEGFFISCFKKTEASGDGEIRRKTKDHKARTELHADRWLKTSDGIKIITHQDELFAIRKLHEPAFQHLQSNLYIKKSGVRLGKVIGKDLIPDHELAISLLLSDDIKRIDLTREEAIAYLKRDDLKIDNEYKGWAVMCYNGQSLGWAKLLGNRINNYFPKELRIISQHIT